MFAPDVCKGTDGRYYLYYGLSFSPSIRVAVCDEPAGRYEFYGSVRHPDGTDNSAGTALSPINSAEKLPLLQWQRQR